MSYYDLEPAQRANLHTFVLHAVTEKVVTWSCSACLIEHWSSSEQRARSDFKWHVEEMTRRGLN